MSRQTRCPLSLSERLKKNLFKIGRDILVFACLLYIILFYESQLNDIENKNLKIKRTHLEYMRENVQRDKSTQMCVRLSVS